MIAKALTLLVSQLNQFIDADDQAADSSPDVVILGNIALAENNSSSVNGTLNNVVLSLVNIEEEKRLKNNRTHIQRGSQVQYVNPTINLNLYLLLSASFDNYETALHRLSQIIEFFQGKNVFTFANSPNSGITADDAELRELKLILDIHTLNFEQINDLWGSLGGKQVPFVMYRTRLITLQRDVTLSTSPSIEEITERSN